VRTTVKKWFSDKGFGFLHNGSEGSLDILVSAAELKNCEYLKPGRIVEFDCGFNDKGLIARNVYLVHEETKPKTLFNDHWHNKKY
jgi:CspA family cold shock protein